MSTNSLNLKRFLELSQHILREYDEITATFNNFQHNNKLNCLPNCGKCCFKPDIYCTPLELLPLALEFLSRGDAEKVYALCLEKHNERCLLLNVDNEEKFQGKCSEYNYRPLICRTFGVSARHGKKDNVDYSVCKVIKEDKSTEYYELLLKNYPQDTSDLPYIDLGKNRLAALDPRFLSEEYPINQSLRIILEKVLLYASYENEISERP